MDALFAYAQLLLIGYDVFFFSYQINEQFAIDLVAEEPVVVVKGGHTWCDGGWSRSSDYVLMLLCLIVMAGHDALGHPKVYINLDKPEINVCGYCGRRFVAETHKSLFADESFVDL